MHSRRVALVMDPVSGLVSPKFHIKADHGFDTVKGTTSATPAAWLRRAGFIPAHNDRSPKLQGLEHMNKRASSLKQVRNSKTSSLPQQTRKSKKKLKTTQASANINHHNSKLKLSSSTKTSKSSSPLNKTNQNTHQNKKRKSIILSQCNDNKMATDVLNPYEMEEDHASKASKDRQDVFQRQSSVPQRKELRKDNQNQFYLLDDELEKIDQQKTDNALQHPPNGERFEREGELCDDTDERAIDEEEKFRDVLEYVERIDLNTPIDFRLRTVEEKKPIQQNKEYENKTYDDDWTEDAASF